MKITASALPSLVKEAFSKWSTDNAMRLAASLSFYTILSITPLLVIITAVAGLVFGEEAATGRLLIQLRSLLGDAGQR